MLNQILFAVVFLSIPVQVFSFLSDSDPQNWVTLTERAPLVAVGQVVQSEAPSGTQRYYLHELKLSEILSGRPVEGRVWVLQEVVFPDEKSVFPPGEFSVFLAGLPRYTAYRAAVDRGVAYRLFGGRAAVLPLAGDSGETLRRLVKELAALRGTGGVEREQGRRGILFPALGLHDARISNDAAAVLESLNVSAEKLSEAENRSILEALSRDDLKPASQIILVRLLQRSGDTTSAESLKKIAAAPASTKKWIAVEALEVLGIPRSTRERFEDFERAEEAQKPRALRLILKKPDGETQAFLKTLLAGPANLVIKKEAIAQMAQIGGPIFEPLLVEQTYNPQEPVAAAAVLALGPLPSSAGVERILQLIDSPSPTLRSAARWAIQQSKDPRARKVSQERIEDASGHSHGHFY